MPQAYTNKFPELFNFYPNQTELAFVLGVTPQAVNQWVHQGFPVQRALQIERMSGGHVKREHLLPHIFET
jgi:DNA-binding transcriptional regulator YdaS (Cro superfamily)